MPRRASTNAAGLERTIRALRDRLAASDEALVALARGLAAAVDTEPTGCGACGGGSWNAALWREYRAAVAALIQTGSGSDLDDDTQAFLVSISTPVRTPMGDKPQS